MVDWITDSVGSVYSYLSPGCQICMQGAGLVLFLTGRCERSCFYCPISGERRGKDQAYANEQPVRSIQDILDEGRAMDALGTGITGGEPLLRLDHLLECVRAIKSEFGQSHHVHLYTGLLPSSRVLRRLRAAGLDEIRFHPPPPEWNDVRELSRALSEAASLGLLAGVEIPAIRPAPAIVKAVRSADAFLNINELEFSETNFEALREQGFLPQDLGCGAEGSEEIARSGFLLRDLKVHYCPSRFKDAVQLRERLKRRARRTARAFDHISEEGTVIHGIIEGDLGRALRLLQSLEVPTNMFLVREGRIDIAAPILEDISKELKSIDCIISVVERYPLEDGLVVDRIQL